MGISLKGDHLKRYKDIAALLIKYGRSDLVKNAQRRAAAVSDGGFQGGSRAPTGLMRECPP